MSEDSGVWLSASRPPKGFQQTLTKHNKVTLSKKRHPNKLVTTTFFSANLTQNSPPPSQLLTARKQSSLMDYFGKGNKHKSEKKQAGSSSTSQAVCTASAHSYFSVENTHLPTLKDVDIEEISDVIHCNTSQSKQSFGASAAECEIISHSGHTGCQKSTATSFGDPEKCNNDLKTNDSLFTYFDEKENMAVFHKLAAVCTNREDVFISQENFNHYHKSLKSPAKILKLPVLSDQKVQLIETKVLSELSDSNCDHIVNFDSSVKTFPSYEQKAKTFLTFAEDKESLDFTSSGESLALAGNEQFLHKSFDTQNEHFFQARKLKHYMDMGTLSFTEETTK